MSKKTPPIDQMLEVIEREKISIPALCSRFNTTSHYFFKHVSKKQIKEAKERRKNKIKEMLMEDYNKGMLIKDILKKYNLNATSFYTYVSKDELSKPDPPPLVPMILDHYEGATLADLASKYDITEELAQRLINKAQRKSRSVSLYQLAVEYEHKHTVNELAEKYDISRQAILGRLKMEGYISKRERTQEAIPTDEIVEAYLTGMSIKDVAEKLLVRPAIVSNVLKKEGVPRHDQELEATCLHEIISLYEGGMKAEDIGELYDSDGRKILAILNKHGVETRKVGDYLVKEIDVDQALSMRAKGMSYAKIARHFGVCYATLKKKLP